MYDVKGIGHGPLKLLDSVQLRMNVPIHGYCRPRVDPVSSIVYVPCTYAPSVFMYSCLGDRLVERGSLKCAENAVVSFAVNKAHSLYVCDSQSVRMVNPFTRAEIRKLDKPEQVSDATPRHVSVLGETALVCYGDNTLVTYRSDSPTVDKVLQTPEELGKVTNIATDGHSSFLVTDRRTGVLLLDREGNPQYMIQPSHGTWGLQDCAVQSMWQSQLWLGYAGGQGPLLNGSMIALLFPR